MRVLGLRLLKALWPVLLCLNVACATNSPPLPAAVPTIPLPPVTLGPEHSQALLPKALDYSQRVQNWLGKLPGGMTSVPLK